MKTGALIIRGQMSGFGISLEYESAGKGETDAVGHVFRFVVDPLVKIAERVGVKPVEPVPEGKRMPDGLFIVDANGDKQYNYVEVIDAIVSRLVIAQKVEPVKATGGSDDSESTEPAAN